MTASVRPSDKGGPHPENQRKRTELQGPRRALLGLLAVAAIGALTLGILLIRRPGGGFLRLTPEMLGGSLTSFLSLGVVLVILVGGTQVLGASLLVLHHPRARLVAAVAGGIAVATSAGLVVMLTQTSWLHAALFGVGFLELLLVAASTPRKPAKHKHRPGRGR